MSGCGDSPAASIGCWGLAVAIGNIDERMKVLFFLPRESGRQKPDEISHKGVDYIALDKELDKEAKTKCA